MVTQAQDLVDLSAAELMAMSRRGRQAEDATLSPRWQTGPAPLSSAQESLWLLEQFADLGPAYTIALAFSLTGRLNRPALEWALDLLLCRHDILRTRFVEQDAQPRQIVDPAGSAAPEFLDLTGRPETTQEVAWQPFASQWASRPFALAGEWPIRFLLIRLAEQHHVLVIALHHLAGDGWSVRLLLDELGVLYGSRLANAPPPAPPALQYADFATWQNHALSGAAQTRQLAYWRGALQDAPAYIDLPIDYPRPPVTSFAGHRICLGFVKPVIKELGALCQLEGATLVMGLLASYAMVLARYARQEEIVIGVPSAGRLVNGVDDMIGCFINMLPMRVTCAKGRNFRELIRDLREFALGAYANQDCPFREIVEALAPARDLSRAPIFQVSLSMQDATGSSLQLPGIASQSFGIDTKTAKYEMTALIWTTPDGSLEGSLEYATGLFSEAFAVGLSEHWNMLLQQALADPDRPVHELSMLSDQETAQITARWNSTDHPVDLEQNLASHFEAAVRKNPGSIALDGAFGRLTYAELNARADGLAGYLRMKGVGPEVIVGLLTERSIETIVGLLAILKAGGAFLPLDPGYPAKRIRMMLDGANARHLLFFNVAKSLYDGFDGEMIDLRTAPATLPVARHTKNAQLATAHSLAYVIYTSGSTGTPKAVAMEQACLINLATWHIDRIGVKRVLQATSMAFDISSHEIFSALLGGGTLLLLPEDIRCDPSALWDFIIAHTVEDIHGPQTFLEILADEATRRDLQNLPLKNFFQGGEPLVLTEPVISLFDARSQAVLWNLYGATEVHVTSCEPIAAPLRLQAPRPLIGGLIWNARYYILDENLLPVPVGVPGEVYVGCLNMARGYHGDEELSATRFLPDPFRPGERIYKTGDLARFHAGAKIEFLGRTDHQVKLRGIRVELGEVEAALKAIDGVQNAVANLAEGQAARLIAYVVPQPGCKLQQDAMRRQLRSKLPEILVPDIVMTLPRLPKTNNGKLDRNALPLPDFSAQRCEIKVPVDPLEVQLLGLWQEMLQRPDLGTGQDFFEEGGHSLLAIRLISRIRDAIGAELPLRMLFDAPSVSAFAAALRSVRLERDFGVPALTAIDRGEDLQPLSYAQARLWFLDQLGLAGPAYNLPMLLRLRGTLQLDHLQSALAELAARHETLRTRFVSHHGVPEAVVEKLPKISIVVHDFGSEDVDKQRSSTHPLIQKEIMRPFQLDTGPLFRTAVFRFARDHCLVLLTMHHIVTDGWSMQILQEELSLLYDGLRRGQPPRLQALALQYGDFAAWEKRRLSAEALSRLEAYWSGQLAGASHVLNLPCDRPRPATMVHRGGIAARRFSVEASTCLQQLCRAHCVTPFMVIVAACYIPLARWSGQRDILLGMPIAGRPCKQLENLVGMFVNTGVLRIDGSDNPSIRELLSRVREAAIGAYAHQDMPFERLVEILQPRRDLNRHPLFQVMINGVNHVMPAASDDALGFDSMEVVEPSPKFDLTFYFKGTGNNFGIDAVYSADLFDSTTIAELLDQVEHVLLQMTASELHVEEISLLTQHGQEVSPRRQDIGLPERSNAAGSWVSYYAARYPQAIAVSDVAEEICYGNLEVAKMKLAAQLRELGACPGSFVAILGDRRASLVMAMLAVHQAGAAFCVLDPAVPAPRLQAQLEILSPVVIIKIGEVPAGFDIARWRSTHWLDFRLQRVTDIVAELPVPLTWCQIAHEFAAPAYVVFTSGSTGAPKAVLTSHGPLDHFIDWQHETFGLRADDRFALLSGLAHDPLLRDVFATLRAGARLFIPPAGIARSADLGAWCGEHAISVVHWTPSLSELATASAGCALPDLRWAFFAGERLITRHLATLRRLAPNCICVNFYGSTETPQAMSFHIAGTSGRGESQLVPIGQGIDGVDLQLVNKAGMPAGIGELAEICIATPYLSLGYLNDPAMTEAKFFPPGQGKSAIYRTGDLARLAGDGSVLYAGRADRQFKLHGHRIEPGEIEAALLASETIIQAYVMLRENFFASSLVAFVVQAPGSPEPAAVIRERLRRTLPEHLCPSLIITIPTLPLTGNGKIDEAMLVTIEDDFDFDDYEPAQSALEAALIEIWEATLQTAPVGRNNNFFELGGASLLAAQVISRVQQNLGVNVSLRALFEAPTVAELASLIEDISLRSKTEQVTAAED